VETRRFGNTDMLITPIGFGSWAIGAGDFRLSEREVREIETIAGKPIAVAQS
jgi:aryl-alcohol dehydrogenase-like predicted oxidoreductase